MPRPRKCCRVDSVPGTTYFKPARIPMSELKENHLTVEELEAIRLRDIEDLDQEQCAARMGVSRATYQRVLASARKKVADALLNGKAIRISGGNFRQPAAVLICPNGHRWEVETGTCRDGIPPCPVCNKEPLDSFLPQRCSNAAGAPGTATAEKESLINKNDKKNKEKTMKIAVITDDGTTISQHFGMATMYTVLTVENGKIVGRENREKKGHQHLDGGSHSHSHAPGQPHGFDADSQTKHATMAQPINDCQVLIAGGMGRGAYESLKSYNIEPVITNVRSIDEAAKLYVEGKLPSLIEKLH